MGCTIIHSDTRRTFLLTTVALGAFVASAAHGAEAARPDGATGLDEIVVTAQKRETKLQDTPISISALQSEDLVARHAQSLEDLGDGSIPSLRIAPFFARSPALTVGTRGIGALGDANQPARDQAVGVYVDGVYLGRAQGLGSALYDVERIEVLKGPQGTLFGRNTEGGAISIVTTSTTDPHLSDKSFIVNGRVAISDIRMGGCDARLQVALWARNLFNEQHVFLRNFNASLGTYGIFNDPRTFGVEGLVRF
ncbi:TonB-dependent receptor plug domain-containing protein [Phenylobacterium sp.]|jgi:outer membrane receptor protein involved in Fe transport|uniref:TonB-dependent receptor plug domain-containing protein n=1 Tax=Phenylobacterium sp. TaxID=1871053 RepID=UPI002F404DF4